jgi:hypothetical protein
MTYPRDIIALMGRREQSRRYREKYKEQIAAKKSVYGKRTRDVARIREAKYRNTHRDRVRARNRDRLREQLYGITPTEVQALLVAQKHCCAICERPITERADIDHDHLTNAVRGLLCRRCNIWLAAIEDPGFCTKARAYLARSCEESKRA